jgi:hypothetical protein
MTKLNTVLKLNSNVQIDINFSDGNKVKLSLGL